MLFLFLLLGLSPELPDPLSLYVLNPVTGYYEADWRLGPAFHPLKERVSISRIGIPLLDDPSVLSSLGFERISDGGRFELEPFFFKDSVPVTLLFSERGTSDLTHLGFLFGTPFRGKNGFSFSLDNRYFSPEYAPARIKANQLTLSLDAGIAGTPFNAFLLKGSRAGVLPQKDEIIFGFLRIGSDSILTLRYTSRRKPGWPQGENLGFEGRYRKDRFLFMARGELDWRRSEYSKASGLELRFSPLARKDWLLIFAGLDYDSYLGCQPLLGARLERGRFILGLIRRARSLPFALRKGGASWEKSTQGFLRASLGSLFSISWEATRLEDAIIYKEGEPTQLSSSFDLIEGRPELRKSFGPFGVKLEAKIRWMSREISELRKVDARARLFFEKDFSNLEIRVNSALILDYFGQSKAGDEFMTAHLVLNLYLFRVVNMKFSLFNMAGRVPEKWPLPDFPERTIHFGMSVMLWD